MQTYSKHTRNTRSQINSRPLSQQQQQLYCGGRASSHLYIVYSLVIACIQIYFYSYFCSRDNVKQYKTMYLGKCQLVIFQVGQAQSCSAFMSFLCFPRSTPRLGRRESGIWWSGRLGMAEFVTSDWLKKQAELVSSFVYKQSCNCRSSRVFCDLQ